MDTAFTIHRQAIKRHRSESDNKKQASQVAHSEHNHLQLKRPGVSNAVGSNGFERLWEALAADEDQTEIN
eukprot:c47890_g1_i1 orf=1-207(-)